VIEEVVAGEDQVIKDTETLTILFDVLLYEARSRISDNTKYERLKRYLSRKGFSPVKHGKNKSLDGTVDEVEIRLSHNYKLNRHRFEFGFPKGFKLMECHLFVHNFLKRIHDNPDDYEIGPVASELTVDLKINDIIENLIENTLELNEETKRELEEVLREVKNGEFLTHEEVKKRLGPLRNMADVWGWHFKFGMTTWI
jgi:predicted transcriptional regulator